MHYQLIQGTTAAIQFQLLEAGSPIDLTGCTVTLLLSDKTGTTISSPGTVTVNTAAEGKVQLAPASITTFDSTISPYTARWKIVDGSGKIYYVPTGPRDVWNITGA